jgi:branched-chain amino acid transport system substrate-binding protein
MKNEELRTIFNICYSSFAIHHLLFIILLSACGFPGTVRPTVKIGLVAPFEGRYRYVGYDVIHAVRLALHEANAAGGVGGYYVELAAYDDAGDPVMAIEQARKLVVDPAVVAALGHFRAETTASGADIYTEAGLPLIALTGFESAYAQEPKSRMGIFRLGPGSEALSAALLRSLPTDASADSSEITLVSEGGPLGRALRRASPRIEQLHDVGQLQGQPQGQLLGQPQGIAPTVICDADPVTAGEVVAALREADWEGDFVGGPALAASDFSAVGGEAAVGAHFVTPWPFPSDVPGGEDFAAAYRAISNGVDPGPLALPAYEATWLLLEALERAITVQDKPTRAGMGAAIPEVKREGLLGPIAFDGADRWGEVPFYQYQIGSISKIEPIY